MNLIYGEIVDVFIENGMQFGKISIGGVTKIVSIGLLDDGARGDTVLVCDGVAIAKMENQNERSQCV